MNKSNFKNDVFQKNRMDAIVKCSMFMIEKKRADIAGEILKTMKIDRKSLAEFRAAFYSC